MSYFCRFYAIIFVLMSDMTERAVFGRKFYLVPILTRDCMTSEPIRPGHRGNAGLMKVDDVITVDHVELYRPVGENGRTKVLEFPGCFRLNITVNITVPPSTNLILFESFKWHQTGGDSEVLDLGCQNPDNYGCGGIGNRCYYCDVCNRIKEVNKKFQDHNKLNVECPRHKGVYNLQESHCINDWGDMDKDNDGDPDFLQNENYGDYRKLLQGLKTSGLGSMSLQIYIAHNATGRQQGEMAQHKQILQRTYGPSLAEDKWADTHKRFWLPKLVHDNKQICVEILFNVCEHKPLSPFQLENYECDE